MDSNVNSTTLLIRKMAGIAILLASSIILTFISNTISIAGLEINLSLLPIGLAAILYGPFAGLFIGVMNGLIVLLAPGTSVFLSMNPVLTVFLCLGKTGLAGLISGYLFRWLRKVNFNLAIVVASLIIPILNTGLFVLGCLAGFNSLFGAVVTLALLINFSIEIAINIVLSPSIVFLIKKYMRDHGEYFNLETKRNSLKTQNKKKDIDANKVYNEDKK